MRLCCYFERRQLRQNAVYMKRDGFTDLMKRAIAVTPAPTIVLSLDDFLYCAVGMTNDVETASRLAYPLAVGSENTSSDTSPNRRENVGRLDAEGDVLVGGEDIPQAVIEACIIPIVDDAATSDIA